MDQTIFNVVVISSIASGLAPLLFYPSYRKPLPLHNRVLISIAALSVVSDIVLYSFAKTVGANHGPANFFLIAHFIGFTVYFYLLVDVRSFRKLLAIGFAVYLLTIVLSIYSQRISTFYNYAWAVSNVLLSTYAILYLSQIPKMPLQRYVDRNLYCNVIVNFSIAAYFVATLFMVLVSQYVFTQLTPNEGRLFWSFHNLINILKNIGLAVGLYYSGRREPYITLEQLERIGTPKPESITRD